MTIVCELELTLFVLCRRTNCTVVPHSFIFLGIFFIKFVVYNIYNIIALFVTSNLKVIVNTIPNQVSQYQLYVLFCV